MGRRGQTRQSWQNASMSTKVASVISKLKDSALQLMTYISNLHKHKDEDYVTKVDEEFSQEPDLEAYGTPTNQFKDSPTNSPTSSSITHLSRSSTPLLSPDQHEPSCECHGQQKLSNPIAQAFRDVELGKVFVTMVMPMATILLAVPNRESSPQLLPLILCLISAAMVFLFYGNSFRIMYPKIANAFEQLGTACMYASFFTATGSHLPPTLAWFSLVCFIACIILSAVSCLPFEKKKCWYCSKVLKSS